MVIWIIGMSASGKTTIAGEMIKLLRQPSEGEQWERVLNRLSDRMVLFAKSTNAI
tara:strand:- start:509 stop:673 length:165 start_codon:yes stop_codon:yes gene_type:complete